MPHLLVASVFGGLPAACCLLERNERLLEGRRRIPWGSLAFWALLLEVGGALILVAWLGEPANRLYGFVPLMALLLVIAHYRYREPRKRIRPANPQDAVTIGWIFLVLRIGLFLAFASTVRGWR